MNKGFILTKPELLIAEWKDETKKVPVSFILFSIEFECFVFYKD